MIFKNMSHRKNRVKQPKRQVFSSPGTLNYIGQAILEKPLLRIISFDDLKENKVLIEEKKLAEINLNPSKTSWLEVDGIHEPVLIQEIGQKFNLHPLLLEDVLNTLSKPKVEFFHNDQVFILAKTIHFSEENLELIIEQISFVLLNKTTLISFQERNDFDSFLPVINRLKDSIGKTRSNKADYLLFALLDLVVDNYFITLEKISEKLESIEDCIFTNPENIHQTQLYNIKRALSNFKKHVFNLRESINSLIQFENQHFQESTMIYLRDLQDHVVQTLEGIESNRETADSLMNFYLSQLSNRMNSVMKTLTVFTAIFMPLSFIAGMYGMNFEHMPELKFQFGYFYTLGVMALTGIGLLCYFKWKKYV